MSDPIVPAPGAQGNATPPPASTAAGLLNDAGAPPPADPGAPPAAPDWMTGFNDDLKGYVQNKGFKTPADMADSYKHLEKLMGVPKEQLLKLPQKEEDADSWNAVYSKLGRPEKADDYKINAPEKGADENFVKWAKGTFHELGLSAKQAEKLSGKYNEYLSGISNAHQEAFNQTLTTELNGLKKEWGAAFEQNRNVALKAKEQFGISDTEIDALSANLGFARMTKLLHQIGSSIGEDQFISGKSKGMDGALTPAQAKDRISALKHDKSFVTRYTNGELDAVAEMKRLHSFAHPEE